MIGAGDVAVVGLGSEEQRSDGAAGDGSVKHVCGLEVSLVGVGVAIDVSDVGRVQALGRLVGGIEELAGQTRGLWVAGMSVFGCFGRDGRRSGREHGWARPGVSCKRANVRPGRQPRGPSAE